jgi:hypothetical protein
MKGYDTLFSLPFCNIRQFKQRTKVYLGRYDTQHNDIQHNDHNDMNITKNKSRNSAQCHWIQRVVMLSVIYAESHK